MTHLPVFPCNLTSVGRIKEAMHPSILAISSAVPLYALSQPEIAEKILALLSPNEMQSEEILKLYKNSAIQTRYSVVPDFQESSGVGTLFDKNYPETLPGMSKRNDIYKKEAPLLAKKAASKALEQWGRDPGEITHVISVSCTGMVAPGIEFELMQMLNLKRSVQRLGLNFMGCFGAFKALMVAQALAKENPQHRILIVCTELCSLHFQSELTQDNILANALFSDGSAAAIVGITDECPLWEMHRSYSIGLDHTLDKMAWEASDHGFCMKLSSTVPVYIRRHIGALIKPLLEEEIKPDECDWAIHPGGKSILQALEKALALTKDQTQASWNTLESFGNMSSATFLFVLESLAKKPRKREWCIGVGFGPGLSMEGILLRKGK